MFNTNISVLQPKFERYFSLCPSMSGWSVAAIEKAGSLDPTKNRLIGLPARIGDRALVTVFIDRADAEEIVVF
jgi:hypothetical protein